MPSMRKIWHKIKANFQGGWDDDSGDLDHSELTKEEVQEWSRQRLGRRASAPRSRARTWSSLGIDTQDLFGNIRERDMQGGIGQNSVLGAALPRTESVGGGTIRVGKAPPFKGDPSGISQLMGTAAPGTYGDPSGGAYNERNLRAGRYGRAGHSSHIRLDEMRDEDIIKLPRRYRSQPERATRSTHSVSSGTSVRLRRPRASRRFVRCQTDFKFSNLGDGVLEYQRPAYNMLENVGFIDMDVSEHYSNFRSESKQQRNLSRVSQGKEATRSRGNTTGRGDIEHIVEGPRVLSTHVSQPLQQTAQVHHSPYNTMRGGNTGSVGINDIDLGRFGSHVQDYLNDGQSQEHFPVKDGHQHPHPRQPGSTLLSSFSDATIRRRRPSPLTQARQGDIEDRNPAARHDLAYEHPNNNYSSQQYPQSGTSHTNTSFTATVPPRDEPSHLPTGHPVAGQRTSSASNFSPNDNPTSQSIKHDRIRSQEETKVQYWSSALNSPSPKPSITPSHFTMHSMAASDAYHGPGDLGDMQRTMLEGMVER